MAGGQTPHEAEECAGWLNGTRGVYSDAMTRGAALGGFTSQYRQDRALYELLFENMSRPGVYLDVAANHYKRISNTYFYDRCLGWRGLCVEPNPIYHEELRAHRTCSLVPTCASDKVEDVTITLPTHPWVGGLGGVNGGRLHEFRRAIPRRQRESVTRNMTCSRVGDELRSHGIHRIDLFSLDVEGFEAPVLRGIDFCRVHVAHVLCEAGCAEVLRPLGYEERRLRSVPGEDRLWSLPAGRRPPACRKTNERNNQAPWGNRLRRFGS